MQTVDKIIRLTQDLPMFIKKNEILEVKHKRNVSFLEAREIIGTNMGENSYASVAQMPYTINQDNKYRAPVDK